MLQRERRARILRSAVQAFGRLGYNGVSVDEIARDAGVAKGTIYLACKSKEDLYYQAVLQEVKEFLAECACSFDPRMPADDLLEKCTRDGIGFLQQRPLVRDLLAWHLDQLPEWRARFMELRDMSKSAIAEILRVGVRQGVFRPDLDIDETAALLRDMQAAGYIFYVVGKQDEGQEGVYLQRTLAGLRLILDGLRSRSSP
jgi:AcrR family transcriptional regulator